MGDLPQFFGFFIGFGNPKHCFSLVLYGGNSEKKAHFIAGAANFIASVGAALGENLAVGRNILPKEIKIRLIHGFTSFDMMILAKARL